MIVRRREDPLRIRDRTWSMDCNDRYKENQRDRMEVRSIQGTRRQGEFYESSRCLPTNIASPFQEGSETRSSSKRRTTLDQLNRRAKLCSVYSET